MASDSPQEDVSARNSIKSNKWLGRGLEVLLFVVLVMGVRAWQQRDIAKGMVPPLSGVLLDGKPFIFPAKPERPMLVHFWATWCPVCRAELGSIDALALNNPNIITVAMQSGSSSEVRQYMHEQQVNFPVLNDADGRISSSWGVSAVPASFVVDTEGEIRYIEIGYTTGVGLRLRMWLAGF